MCVRARAKHIIILDVNVEANVSDDYTWQLINLENETYVTKDLGPIQLGS